MITLGLERREFLMFSPKFHQEEIDDDNDNRHDYYQTDGKSSFVSLVNAFENLQVDVSSMIQAIRKVTRIAILIDFRMRQI